MDEFARPVGGVPAEIAAAPNKSVLTVDEMRWAYVLYKDGKGKVGYAFVLMLPNGAMFTTDPDSTPFPGAIEWLRDGVNAKLKEVRDGRKGSAQQVG